MEGNGMESQGNTTKMSVKFNIKRGFRASLYLNTRTHAKGRTVYKNDVDAGIIKSCTSNNANSSITSVTMPEGVCFGVRPEGVTLGQGVCTP